MFKLLTITTLIIFVAFQGLDLYAQKIKVITTSIQDVDNKLVIKYDIQNQKPGQSFKVTLEVTSSSGNLLAVKSLNGDIGDNVEGGLNKQIVWDYNADGIVLQDNINIEIFADPIIDKNLPAKHIGVGKALMLSTICPGLGMSKIEKGKPYWLMGIVAYGTLGYSYILNKKANENYDSYIANTDKNINDELLSDSQSQNKLSKTMTYTAIGIWGINLVWTAIKAKNSKQKDLVITNNQRLQFYPGYDPWTKTTCFNLKLQF
jgi:hypothetical protein